MAITLKCSVRGLETSLRNATDKVRRATQAAGTSGLRAMRAEGSRRIRDRKGIQASQIDRALTMLFPSNKDVLVWSLVAKAKPLPIIAFGARQTKTGVSVEVTKGSRRILRHAFIATMASGHRGVFMREGPKRIASKGRYVGKKRQPIHEAFTASVASALGQASPEVMERGRSVFRATLERMMRER